MSNGTEIEPRDEGDAEASQEWARQVLADPEARSGAYARLTISGGLPEEGAEPLTIDMSAAGEMPFALEAAPAGAGRHVSLEMDEDILATLFGAVEGGAVAIGMNEAAPAEPPDIPPDSVVGRLEVSVGEARRELVFMADEEQAKTAGHELPAPAAAAVRKMVDLANAEERGEAAAAGPAAESGEAGGADEVGA